MTPATATALPVGDTQQAVEQAPHGLAQPSSALCSLQRCGRGMHANTVRHDPTIPATRGTLQAGRVTLQALALSGVLGTGVALLLTLGAEPALALMGADPSSGALHHLSRDYLVIRWETAAPRPWRRPVGCRVPRSTR